MSPQRSPRGGAGSNQYRTRPGLPPRRWARRREPIDDDAERVAWQFDPDRGAWEWEGFTWRQARAWRQVGITDPVTAALWSTTNRSPEHARPWIEAGFPPPQDNDFYRFFAGTPAEAASWRDAGWTAKAALRFRTQNVDPVELARQWQEKGFTTQSAVLWVEGQFTPGEAMQAAALNWHPFTAARARQKGIDPTVSPPADGGLPQ